MLYRLYRSVMGDGSAGVVVAYRRESTGHCIFIGQHGHYWFYWLYTGKKYDTKRLQEGTMVQCSVSSFTT